VAFFRTWVGIFTVGFGSVVLGIIAGFLFYCFCKRGDRWKKWKKFNKVNPLKRMRHRMFSEGARVYGFLRRKRVKKKQR
jgi:uncharacterized protein (DUF779 family)